MNEAIPVYPLDCLDIIIIRLRPGLFLVDGPIRSGTIIVVLVDLLAVLGSNQVVWLLGHTRL